MADATPAPHPTVDDGLLARAQELVAGAERVMVLTGAGISTDSGIPDFRGPQGVWTKNPEAEKQATIDVYLHDPEIRERAWRRRIDTGIFRLEPNPGHHALVDFEATGRLELLATQNVDGLHRAAGTDPDKLAEVHGNVREVECVSCDFRAPIEGTVARVEAGEPDPACEACGGILKPTVVFFGELLPERELERSFAAAQACDLFLAVGTTLVVYPIASTADEALRRGVPLVILNGEPTGHDRHAAAVLRGSISDVLPRLVSAP